MCFKGIAIKNEVIKVSSDVARVAVKISLRLASIVIDKDSWQVNMKGGENF